MSPLEMKALFVGVCVVAGFALWLALSLIWARRKHSHGRNERALPSVYYGIPVSSSRLMEPGTVIAVGSGDPRDVVYIKAAFLDRPPRLYDWAKREPMIWGRS